MFELHLEDKNGNVVESSRDFTLLSLDRSMTSGSFLIKMGTGAFDISDFYFGRKGVLYWVENKKRKKIFTGFYFGLEKFEGFIQILFSSVQALLAKKEEESISFTGNFPGFLDFLGVEYLSYDPSMKEVSYVSENVSQESAIEEFSLLTGNEWRINDSGTIDVGEVLFEETTAEQSIENAGNFELEYMYSAENFVNSVVLIEKNGKKSYAKNEESIAKIGEFKRILSLDIELTQKQSDEMAIEVLSQLLITEHDIKIAKPLGCENSFLDKKIGDFIDINYSDCDVSINTKKRIVEQNIIMSGVNYVVQLVLSNENFQYSSLNNSIIKRLKRVGNIL